MDTDRKDSRHYERRQKGFTVLRKGNRWFTARPQKGVTCCDAQLWFKSTTKGDRKGSRHRYKRRQMWFTALRKETDVVHGTTKGDRCGSRHNKKETERVNCTTKGDRRGSRHYERRQMWFTARLQKGVTCCDAQLWFKGTTKGNRCGPRALRKETERVHGTTKGDRCGSRHYKKEADVVHDTAKKGGDVL